MKSTLSPSLHTLSMCSGVSGRLDHVGTFSDAAMADAVGRLLLEADKKDYPEWISYAVEPQPAEASRSPSYEALLLIAQSVCGALARAGLNDCDDPGEAIDVLRGRFEARIANLESSLANRESE